MLWTRYKEDKEMPEKLWLRLGFDASDGFHTYALKYVYKKMAGTPTWTLVLKIDGNEVAELIGVPVLPLGGASTLTVHRWLAADELPPINEANPLDVWTDNTILNRVTVSLVGSPLACQDAFSWWHFSSPVTYEAAVGTVMHGVDVKPYTKFEIDPAQVKYYNFNRVTDVDEVVEGLPRPCFHECDDVDCASGDAPHAELMQVPVHVTGLDLALGEWVTSNPDNIEFKDTAESLGIDLKSIEALIELGKHNSTRNPLKYEEGELWYRPATYYISVRAVTGSGKTVSSTSEAITMDTTPPEFAPVGKNATAACASASAEKDTAEEDMAAMYASPQCGRDPQMYDVDHTMGYLFGTPLVLPSKWQSSQTTLAAFWLAVDEESGVQSYDWSLGVPGDGSKLQSWKSVGELTSAITDGLELEHMGSYCTQVRALNGAGLFGYSPTVCTTVDATGPDSSGAFIDVTEPDEQLGEGLVIYASELPIGCSYGGFVDPESGVRDYKLALGLTPYVNDADGETAGQEVMSPATLSGNEDAEVTINPTTIRAVRPQSLLTALADVEEEMSIRDVVVANLPEDFVLTLQRGAKHYFTVIATNHAGSSEGLGSMPLTLLGPKADVRILPASEDSGVQLGLGGLGEVRIGRVPLPTAKSRSKEEAVPQEECKGVLAAGLLKESELTASYTAANTAEGFTFAPYLHDPRSITPETSSRWVRGRASPDSYTGTSFFLTALEQGGNGCPVSLDVTLEGLALGSKDDSAGVVYWDATRQLWSDMSEACGVQSRKKANKDSQHATYTVCDGGAADAFDGSLLVSIFKLVGPIPNTPPMVKDTAVFTDQNTPSAPVQIEFSDAELDDVVISLSKGAQVQQLAEGVANVTADGLFTFTPAFGFVGIVRIAFTATEILPEGLGIKELASTAFMVVAVKDLPERPILRRVDEDESGPAALVAAAWVGSPIKVRLAVIDFDGDQTSLVERGLPVNASIETVPVAPKSALKLANDERDHQCDGDEGCGYPWSTYNSKLLSPSGIVVTIELTLQAEGRTEVSFIAKDSLGLFSELITIDFVACAAGSYFSMTNATTESGCSPLSVCSYGYEPKEVSKNRNLISDTECVFVTNGTNTRSGDDKLKSGAGLAIGLLFVFIALGAVAFVVFKRKEEEAKPSAIALLLESNQNTQSNPMYFGVYQPSAAVTTTGASNPMYTVAKGETKYGVPMEAASSQQYSVPFEEQPSKYSVPFEEDSPQYSVPLDTGGGGGGGTKYSVPMARGFGNDLYAAPMDGLVAATNPADYSLLARGDANDVLSALYGGIYTPTTDGDAQLDVYGWVRGNDSTAGLCEGKTPPWLFTSKLSRTGAESIIAAHGDVVGSFLVRVKRGGVFVLTMKGVKAYEHHLITVKKGKIDLDEHHVTGASTLTELVELLSDKDLAHLGYISTPLTAAICIPSYAPDFEVAPLWLHGALTEAEADGFLHGTGGGKPGVFLVYQSPDGHQTLAVVTGHKQTNNFVVTFVGSEFHVDGQRVPGASTWYNLRTVLSEANDFLLGATLTKGVCRMLTPPLLLSADGVRPAWLHSTISRGAAKKLLKGCDEGTFLARESTGGPHELKLSFIFNKKFQHVRVKFEPVAMQWSVDGCEVAGSTLAEVVQGLKNGTHGSTLTFVLSGQGIANEPEYLVVPVSQVQVATGAKCVYHTPQPEADPTYMDDLQLVPIVGDQVALYDTAGVNSEFVVVGKGDGSDIYQAASASVVVSGGGSDIYVDDLGSASDVYGRPSYTAGGAGRSVVVGAKADTQGVYMDSSLLSAGASVDTQGVYTDVTSTAVELREDGTVALPDATGKLYAIPAEQQVVAGDGAMYAVPAAPGGDMYMSTEDAAEPSYDTPLGDEVFAGTRGVTKRGKDGAQYSVPMADTAVASDVYSVPSATGGDVYATAGGVTKQGKDGAQYSVPLVAEGAAYAAPSESGEGVYMQIQPSGKPGVAARGVTKRGKDGAQYSVPMADTPVASDVYSVPSATGGDVYASGGDVTGELHPTAVADL
jgi:hypothetical protein